MLDRLRYRVVPQHGERVPSHDVVLLFAVTQRPPDATLAVPDATVRQRDLVDVVGVVVGVFAPKVVLGAVAKRDPYRGPLYPFDSRTHDPALAGGVVNSTHHGRVPRGSVRAEQIHGEQMEREDRLLTNKTRDLAYYVG